MQQYWVAFKTIIIGEIKRFSRIWSQTFLPPLITMTLYLLIFGSFIGSHISKIDGVSFMQFIAPGLIMMSVITSSYNNVVASFFSLRFQKSIEELLIAPVPNSLMLLGFVGGGVLRGMITGLLICVVTLFFTHLSIHHFFLMLFVSIFTATLFSQAGFMNAIFAKKFDDIQIVPTFVLAPLTYLGGVFYSVKQLSPFWRDISNVNPILYIVNAFRYSVLGVTDVKISIAIIMILVANVILYIGNIVLLRKGIGIRT